MKDIGVDVVSSEWLQNFTTRADQAMNGLKQWRGPREKSPGFWQMLIEASTLPGDIVLDYTAMTGASIRACCSVGHHLLALEEDIELLSALLAPMVRSPTVSSPPKTQPIERFQDPDGAQIVPSSRVKKRRAKA